MSKELREKHFLAYSSNEKSAIDENARTIRFVISAEEVDRDNEVITVDAVAGAIKGFSDSPVCLACHMHRLDNGMPPVIGSWDTDSFKVLGKRSEMNLRFATTDLGEAYWNLYKNRHMRAVSIGFRCLDGREEMKNGVRIYIITKIELYEISAVAVGANRSALSKIKGLEFLTDNKAVSEQLVDMQKNIIEQLREIFDEKLEGIKLLIVDKNYPGGCGGDLLGDHQTPAVEAKNTESIVNVLNHMLKGC